MFFCAGRGTRMGTLTQHQPKPMVKVAGRPLIDHAMDAMEGVERRFANLHYLPNTLEKYLNLARFETIFEQDLLETGGGLKHALPRINRSEIFTMNTDSAWSGPKPAQWLAQHWQPDIMDGLLLLVPKDRALGHKGTGDFITHQDGTVVRGAGDIYCGLQIIKTQYIQQRPETHFSLNLVWEDLLARGTLFGAPYPGQWCDVGYPDAIPLAETMLEA
jgi:MurNAc alpha-1-phosphate uridylyltransferase